VSRARAKSRGRDRLSQAERQRRRAADRQRIEQAARALLTSEGWRRWVRVRAANGLRRYSFHNQLLVALQTNGKATFVAGFRAWLELGYRVNRGEKAIRILAPMTIKDGAVRSYGEDDDRTRIVFRAVSVFDRSQVSPLPDREPQSLESPLEPLTGDSHARLLDPLRRFAEKLGFSVTFQAIAGPEGGWCDRSARQIVVDAGAPANARVRALVHELAHALGVGYRDFGRERAEVIVDTATYIVCSGVGLDISGESVPYVAGWGEDGALEAVGKFAQTIDGLARRIEDALDSAEAAPELAAHQATMTS
jgi:N-terminal domain of anti-restriction factor ArdC